MSFYWKIQQDQKGVLSRQLSQQQGENGDGGRDEKQKLFNLPNATLFLCGCKRLMLKAVSM